MNEPMPHSTMRQPSKLFSAVAVYGVSIERIGIGIVERLGIADVSYTTIIAIANIVSALHCD